MISLDGPQGIHDQNRIYASNGMGSYTTIMKNINRIVRDYPEFAATIMIHMVLSPQNDYDEILSIVNEPNLSEIEFNTSMVDLTFNGKEVEIGELFIQKTTYQSFLSKLGYFGIINIKDLKLIAYDEVIKLINNFEFQPFYSLGYKDAPSGPCIPGITKLFITCDGLLFPCEKVSELSDFALIGSLKTGFDYQKIYNFLNVAKTTEAKCKECWAIKSCSVCGRCICENENAHIVSCRKAKNSTMDKLRTKVLFFEINKYFKDLLREDIQYEEN